MSEEITLSQGGMRAGRTGVSMRYAVWIALAVALLLLPYLFSSRLAVSTMCLMGTMIIFALSYNMLLGQTGLLSFGHAVFFGLGGYVTVHLLNVAGGGDWPIPLPLFPVIGGLGGLVFGVLFGAVATRRAGTAFAMITLGIGELVVSSALILRRFFGGEEGITTDRTEVMSLFGYSFGPQFQVYYLIAGWCFVSIAAMYAITRTPFGRICNAVRDNPQRTAFIGYDTQRVRFIAFSLAGLFAGIAGGLSVINFEIINASQMGAVESGSVILMTYIGGMGNFAGPIIGAILITWLQLALSDATQIWPLYVGLLFIGMVMFVPGGLAGLLAQQQPLLANRTLHRVVPYYLLALLPGVVAVIGLSILAETSHQFSIRASYGPDLTLYGIPFDVTSPWPWLVGLALTIGGGWLYLRAARLARGAYDEALAEGRAR
ncbi:branched-chain amino acid ABC transporter permease [Mesorhizobium australicum]|uniref:Amino acid/amide ABC transporter membrane protein 2, HAAT family n=1 Tax=Mesorhizobium australicum TaxID=536018 RepID=A0A1X7PT17_9HYPH|nr:branched-chain amino acid ABC transporter permease [Mesorhizobium australicum]SMH54423.1 amino acid/amide ABC transporter membrane protein 2, HAAT family [Mesorhizobium australicum]